VRLNANREEKLPLNAFHSPSPMNELCDYVCTWEKQHILWDGSCSNTQSLLIDNSLDLSNIDIICKIKYVARCFLEEWRYVLCEKDTGDTNIDIDCLLGKYHKQLQQIIPNNEILLANYLIKTCYNTNQGNKHLAWYLYSDVILGNLKKNSPERRKTQIIEVPYSTAGAKEFLGKFYTMIEGDN
jgi:hypothetical protein